MRNAKLVVLTLVTAFSALGCSVRMNSHPEYAQSFVSTEEPQAQTSSPWYSVAQEQSTAPAKPTSVLGDAERVQTVPTKAPVHKKLTVEERFSLK